MICKRCALIGVHRLFFCIFPITSEKQTEAKREPVGSQTGTCRKANGSQTEAKRELIGRQTEPHSNVFWTFPEKKIEKACLYEKEFLSLHPLNSNRVDPLAQLVEHNTFNVGVLGSSPKRITSKIAAAKQPRFAAASFLCPLYYRLRGARRPDNSHYKLSLCKSIYLF